MNILVRLALLPFTLVTMLFALVVMVFGFVWMLIALPFTLLFGKVTRDGNKIEFKL